MDKLATMSNFESTRQESTVVSKSSELEARVLGLITHMESRVSIVYTTTTFTVNLLSWALPLPIGFSPFEQILVSLYMSCLGDVYYVLDYP